MKVIDTPTNSWQILRVVFFIDLCQASNEKLIIFPSYAMLVWGSAHKTHINKVQAKQYHPISLFFCKNFGDQTESQHSPS